MTNEAPAPVATALAILRGKKKLLEPARENAYQLAMNILDLVPLNLATQAIESAYLRTAQHGNGAEPRALLDSAVSAYRQASRKNTADGFQKLFQRKAAVRGQLQEDIGPAPQRKGRKALPTLLLPVTRGARKINQKDLALLLGVPDRSIRRFVTRGELIQESGYSNRCRCYLGGHVRLFLKQTKAGQDIAARNGWKL